MLKYDLKLFIFLVCSSLIPSIKVKLLLWIWKKVKFITLLLSNAIIDFNGNNGILAGIWGFSEIIECMDGNVFKNGELIPGNSLHILNETLEHEKEAIAMYYKLLELVKDDSVYLEEFARSMIGQEELHVLEVEKMLKEQK